MPADGPAAPKPTNRVGPRSLIPILGSTVVFALLDTTAKYTGRILPVLEVAWFRYLINFLMAVVVYNPVVAPQAWKVTQPGLQVVRAMLLAIMTLCNFLAFHYLQLAVTTTIGFLTPLVITALSVVVLHERIDPHRLAAIIGGFIGVLLVTRPGLGGFHPAMLLSLVNVVVAAVYNMLTRHLAQRKSAGSMVLMLAGVPTLLLAPVMPFIWQTPDHLWLWLALIFIGAAGGYGHFLVMEAHRHATAAALAPYSYASLLWIVLTGYVVFGDVPSLWTIVGAAVVVASGLYLLRRERLESGAGRRPDRAQPGGKELDGNRHH